MRSVLLEEESMVEGLQKSEVLSWGKTKEEEDVTGVWTGESRDSETGMRLMEKQADDSGTVRMLSSDEDVDTMAQWLWEVCMWLTGACIQCVQSFLVSEDSLQ